MYNPRVFPLTQFYNFCVQINIFSILRLFFVPASDEK